ncbi:MULTISPECIES: methyltransferase domain-containing protein [Shewanella]|uniref:methyltransferase domain-containing protein n=1 Tax=Shewanella TaxID=22 RepID=UPI0004ACD267|nr:methyltransferase domain-containing protein [Shewanella sp. Scap07]
MSSFLCPKCQQPLMVHAQSAGFYCANKHHYDKHEQGYWVFSQAKKPQLDSRQVMRAKRFLLESGIHQPLIDTLSKVLSEASMHLPASSIDVLDIDCGDGFYLRAIKQQLQKLDKQVNGCGLGEAENALFAGAKIDPELQLIVSQLKQLPLSDDSVDLVSVVDKPLKGKEPLRVLKPGGLLLLVQPAARHLWQIKNHLYDNLQQKQVDINLPKGFELISTQEVNYQAVVSGEQAVTLLQMSPFAWRANDKVLKQIEMDSFAALELGYHVTLAKKSTS